MSVFLFLISYFCGVIPIKMSYKTFSTARRQTALKAWGHQAKCVAQEPVSMAHSCVRPAVSACVAFALLGMEKVYEFLNSLSLSLSL